MRYFESIGYFTTKQRRRAYLIKIRPGEKSPQVGDSVMIDGKLKFITGLDDSINSSSAYTKGEGTCGVEVDEKVECPSKV